MILIGTCGYGLITQPALLWPVMSTSTVAIGALVIAALVALAWAIAKRLLKPKRTAESATLKQSEHLFRDLLDSAEVILWQMDIATGAFTMVTRQTEEILSIPPEIWLAEENFWTNRIHPEDRATADGAFADAIESNAAQTFEHRLKAGDGHYKWLRTSVRLVDRAGHKYLSGVMLDVTARMMIEAALHEERGLFDALMDTLPDHIYFKDLESCFMRVNRAQAEHLGAPSPLRMIGLSDADFFDSIYAQKALADEQQVIRTGSPMMDFEDEEVWPDGRRRWVTTSKMPLRNLNGEIVGTFGVSRDITERKAADEELRERSRQLAQANEELRLEMEERRALQSQLLQAQKLEAIGQLAAGVAHEINTPIQYVGDNCQFLADSFRQLEAMLNQYDKALDALRASGFARQVVSETDQCLDRTDLAYLRTEIPLAIKQSSEGVMRVANIVRAMKEFAHPGSGRKEAIDLNHAIENTLVVCRNEWKYVAAARADLDPSLPPVHCLPGEMNQVLLNLVVNAAHAINQAKQGRERGRILVSTKRDGDFAEIRISDDGTGIAPAIQPRIFDPFFTTKEVGKGTGQGLTLARNIIVKKHGGTLAFETQENVGTTFIIRIPIGGLEEEVETRASNRPADETVTS